MPYSKKELEKKKLLEAVKEKMLKRIQKIKDFKPRKQMVGYTRYSECDDLLSDALNL